MNNDLEYRIRTSGDFSALEKAKKSLQDNIKATRDLGGESKILEQQLHAVEAALGSAAGKAAGRAEELEKAIGAVRRAGGDTSGLTRARDEALKGAGIKGPGKLQEAFSAYKESGGGLEGVKEAAGVFGKGALGAAAAGVASLEVAREALNEYAHSEDQLFARNAALRQRGQETEAIKKDLDELAESLGKVSGIDNDKWTGALTTLIQDGANPEKIAGMAEMVKNVAGLPQYFGDVQSSAQVVGRAINGNFEAFTRMGFVIDDNATQMEKLNALQEQLATRGGGQLEARTQTLTGQFQILRNATSEAFKALGKGVADTGIVQGALYGLGQSLTWVTGKLSGAGEAAKRTKEEIQHVGDEMLTAEQIADQYQRKLEGIKTSAAEAAKKREEFTQKRSKEDQAAIDQKTDEAAFNSSNVDLLEKGGFITHEEAERRRTGIQRGLENFKRSTDLKASDREINSRKIAMDENNAKVAGARDQLNDARKMAEASLAFAEKEKAIATKFDNKIEPKKAEIAKRMRSGAPIGALVPEGEIEEAANADPEIAALRKQKERELARLRGEAFQQMAAQFGKEKVTDRYGNRLDVLDFKTYGRKAREAEGIFSATADAALADNQALAAEKGEAENEKARKARHYQSEIATQAVQDVAGRIPQGGPAATTGFDHGVIATALAPHATAQRQETQILTGVMQEVARNLQGNSSERRALFNLVRQIESELQRQNRELQEVRNWHTNGNR